jgi:hypothetical protein
MVIAMKTREELIGTGKCRNRDQELVRLIGRHGVMRIEQAQRSRSVAYCRFGCCETAGLLERLSIPGIGSVLYPTRYARIHRADLVVLREEGRIAIEVELTPKGTGRQGRIASDWVEAICDGKLAEVHHICPAGQTFRAVERAVAKAQAQAFIAILEAVAQ